MENNFFDFLEGGGKVGEEIRNFNWENTTLGSPVNWPDSLKITLRLILDSTVPFQILWGKDLIHFYNDSYIPILESIGKSSLIGLTAKNSFPDIWDKIEHLLADTLKGNSVFKKDYEFIFNKNGKQVKCYFDFSYNPIKLSDGKVGGVFVSVNETTEKVLAVEDNKDSNERLLFALNAAHLGSFEYDLENNILFLTERARDIFGFEKNQLVNPDDIFECMLPSEIQKIKSTFKTLYSPSEENKFDLKIVINKAFKNEELIIRTVGILLLNAAGKPVKFSGTIQDVTKEELNSRRIKDSEKNFQDLFKNAPVAFCTLKGPDFIVEMINDKMLDLIKRDPKVLINKPAISVFSESVINQLIPPLQSVYSTGKQFIGNEFPLRGLKRESKEIVFVNFIAQYQKAIDRIIVVATDVTDQVLYRKNIEKNEHEFHELANSLIQKVWSVDYNENGIFISDRWREYAGDNFTTEHFLNLVHPFDLDVLNKDWKKAKESKLFFSSVVRLRNKSGEYRWHDGYANPILNTNGEIEKWIGTYSDIHEKKLAEESLKLQGLVLETMDEGVCVWDENGYIIFTNPIQDSTFGFEPGELLGKHISILNSINIDNNTLVEISDAIEKNGSWTGRYLCQSKSGEEFVTQAQINTIDLNGTKMLVSIQRNITEELKRNLEISRFKYMVDNFNDPVVLITADAQFVYLNNTALKVWGYNEEIVKDLTIFDIFPGYSKKKFETAFEMAQHSELPHFELNLVNGYGESFPVELSMSGLMLGDVPYLFAAIRDISDRKKAEMQLALSLKQFREMAETMPQFVWTADSTGSLNYFNKVVFEYSGFQEKDLLGDGYVKMVHKEDMEKTLELWNNSVKTGNAYMIEHRFKRNDGEYRWMLSRAVAQKNKNGETESWVGTSTDIHDRKLKGDLLEQSVESRTIELIKVNARLKQSNSELEQFAYVASHDLQEPLRKIKTFASLMLESSNVAPDNDNHYLQKIISSTERMSVLINDVLNFAKLTHDEKTYDEVNLNEIVNNVKLDLELQIKSKNVSIKCDELPVIKAIPIQMNQLFFNLMSNSLKFGKADEPLIIEIKYRKLTQKEIKNISGLNDSKDYFEILFKDNGMGFDQSYAEKIFNIFQRLNNRSFSGSGIGLALCRRIVIYQGGTIFANSSENKGAEFHIILPYEIKSKEVIIVQQ